jgi:hypothetical protein
VFVLDLFLFICVVTHLYMHYQYWFIKLSCSVWEVGAHSQIPTHNKMDIYRHVRITPRPPINICIRKRLSTSRRLLKTMESIIITTTSTCDTLGAQIGEKIDVQHSATTRHSAKHCINDSVSQCIPLEISWSLMMTQVSKGVELVTHRILMF